MNKKNKKNHEPELLEESYLPGDKQGKAPPYVYLALIVFVILTIIWKGFVAESPEEPRTLSQAEVAKRGDMVK